MSNWQPIETAPQHNGRHLLMHGDAPGTVECCFIASWDECRDCFIEVYSGMEIQATHWMPLPEPPK